MWPLAEGPQTKQRKTERGLCWRMCVWYMCVRAQKTSHVSSNAQLLFTHTTHLTTPICFFKGVLPTRNLPPFLSGAGPGSGGPPLGPRTTRFAPLLSSIEAGEHGAPVAYTVAPHLRARCVAKREGGERRLHACTPHTERERERARGAVTYLQRTATPKSYKRMQARANAHNPLLARVCVCARGVLLC